uniref:Alanine--glyoxylate aminotransferase 2, mitochondrial n=1 Tax=Rhabditophanes sp. KR3021 TaxID=114890 RepID=A0AC35TYP3_9BILA
MNRVQQLRPLLPPSMVTYYKNQLLITRGEMQYLFDDKGKKYLDMFGGIVTVSVGHCHPKVGAALKAQADKLWHTTSIYHTEPIYEYAQKLLSTMPKHLDCVFFTNSGSEANDLAIELARLHTGRFDLLTLRNSYHGMTQTLLGAVNIGSWKQPMPSGFGILKAMCPDPYVGPWGGSDCRDSIVQTNRDCDCGPDQCNANDQYFRQFRETVEFDFPASTGPAGFLVESVQGVGGTVQYPKGWLKQAFELVQSKGGLCISDEVQTGFGRMGSHFWGFESQDAKPDIVTMAKGMGNGFPIGACVTTKEIAASLGKALYFNTFGGNPLASVVGKAVIDVIQEEKLQENSEKVGDYFLTELNNIGSKLIGDVRGKGLMIGFEMIDEEGKFLPSDRSAAIFEDIKDQGVLVGKGGAKGNVLRIKPPMCINKQNVDQCVDAIASALKRNEK